MKIVLASGLKDKLEDEKIAVLLKCMTILTFQKKKNQLLKIYVLDGTYR